MTGDAMAMGKRWRWTLIALVGSPILVALSYYLFVPMVYEFRLRQTTRIDVVSYDLSDLGPRTLTADPAEVKDIVGRLHLWPKRHCACAFAERYVFRSWAGDVEAHMSGHTFDIGWFSYSMSSGVYDRVKALRREPDSRRSVPDGPMIQKRQDGHE